MSNRSSSSALHNSLLRPAILQILRAAGFHAARPSVLDTFTELATRYLLLLARKTADVAALSGHGGSIHNPEVVSREARLAAPNPRCRNEARKKGGGHVGHDMDRSAPNNIHHGDFKNDGVPLTGDGALVISLTDIRTALSEVGALVPSLTTSEEVWREKLRRPLSTYPERNGLRENEAARRTAEDTEDVREWVEWFSGPANREIERIGGLKRKAAALTTTTTTTTTTTSASNGPGAGATNADPAADAVDEEEEDYVSALKRKHNKTGEESKYQGTVLGKMAEEAPLLINGGAGALTSVQDWLRLEHVRSLKQKAKANLNSEVGGKKKSEAVDGQGESNMDEEARMVEETLDMVMAD